ncbi:MAG TPA: methyltransferase domain-containing protein [Vicinamibacterales bacterium]|nr:methyltransferase domain-containing protein [Vicinamibacterales bacterium]
MAWFKSSPPGDPLSVTMTGVKMGDRLIVIGCTKPEIVAQLALKPGLSGRTCAVDADAAASAHAGALATREGALIEIETAPLTMLPYDASSFDVAVLSHALTSMAAERRIATVAEARRLLRPGGRCIAIEPAARGGLAGLIPGTHVLPGDIETAFRAAGLRAVRTLSQGDGIMFVEGASA